MIGSERYKFHLIPSGVLRGKRLLIGAGVALDPSVLEGELSSLAKKGVRADLLIDSRCSLVSPLEKEFDAYLEKMRGGAALGTTRMGLGPAYAMRALRLSPRAGDLFSKRFELGPWRDFYSALGIRVGPLPAWLRSSRRLLKGRIGDVGGAIEQANARGESVLFEAAHGVMLDLLYGSYPFVTSSSTTASFAAAGTGVGVSTLGSALGVVKCYTTRVGAGPFPTEIEGTLAGRLRESGSEYGATTGRARRIGWLDLVALKYAARTSGIKEVALTKIDVLSGLEDVKVCTRYRIASKESTNLFDFLGDLDAVTPVYSSLGPMGRARRGRSMPQGASRLIRFLEAEAGLRVKIVSFGDERSKTIEL